MVKSIFKFPIILSIEEFTDIVPIIYIIIEIIFLIVCTLTYKYDKARYYSDAP